ncbi:MAG TPA: hypothetical protein VHC69_12890 [Polyangiaceae bacterium]|nr:hypothetical protein [Polyangiaceae bacterium]
MIDDDIVHTCLVDLGINFVRKGPTSVVLSGGGYDDVVVDLKTGAAVPPEGMVLDSAAAGLLRQRHAEMKYREEARLGGVELEARVVERDGSIVLMCRVP